MTEEQKKQTTNVEGVQEMIRKVVNKTGGNVCSCSTAGNTAAKEVTLGPSFELVTGAVIVITFENGITVGDATLAVTHTDLAGTTTTEAAKPIYYRGAALGANLVKAGLQISLRYDGTSFNVIGNLTDTVTDITFDSNTNTLKKTVGGQQSDIVQIVNSGFSVVQDDDNGIDEISAIGGASITEDDTNGIDEYDF